ncbi:MAG: ABC transporter ATP-binding protein [Candidatus Omnitrophica bacterium]|nr:ABC transporter ATP-binding protein [Candidatus Omnitrophota bacterium]
MDDNCIKVKQACVTYKTKTGRIEALCDINLSVRDNEFVSILGPSGCGKTTLLKVIGGLINPSNGKVQIKGKSVEVIRKNREIGFVFQNPALLPWRTVWGNVYLPLEIIGINPSSRGEIDNRIMKMLELVGLSGFKDNHPHELSGGMQQRVAIARALIFNPSILLMDEPFGALDEITRDRLNLELLRVWENMKHTVIFVTHSIREAVLLSDRIVVLSKRPGKIVSILEVNLPRPRKTSSRYTEEFLSIAKEAHRLLDNDR